LVLAGKQEWVYLLAKALPNPAKEATPMNIRIQVSRQTVKAMQRRLQEAYQRDDVRLVRRIKALLAHLVDGVSAAQLSAHWGFTPACLYQWVLEFILNGLGSLTYQHAGGRSSKLTPTQKKRLTDLLDAGPEAAGFESACWSSILIRVLIQREFGVLYNRFYVCELLRNLGYSFQKARFVSDHLDEAKRQAWITQEWPQILKAARKRNALILFGDEASFPQWGSLNYTWSKRGQQPLVKTSGKRRGYKVFGLIEFFSGRFFYQGIEERFSSETYQTFLKLVLRQTRKHLFLIQDGAKYHVSQSTRAFLAAHRERLTAYQLPSYSPDYNPIEYLWRNVKKEATHNKYFEAFEHLVHSVDKTLAAFAERAEAVLNLFGCYCKELGLATSGV
jgi:transposase